MNVLTRDKTGDGSDYILKEGAGSCWIEVENLSVYIMRTPTGVQVEILPKGEEADQSLADCYADFPEDREG